MRGLGPACPIGAAQVGERKWGIVNGHAHQHDTFQSMFWSLANHTRPSFFGARPLKTVREVQI